MVKWYTEDTRRQEGGGQTEERQGPEKGWVEIWQQSRVLEWSKEGRAIDCMACAA